jgi:hypothetical protein
MGPPGFEVCFPTLFVRVLAFRHRFLARGGNIFGSEAFEDFLGAFGLFVRLGMHGDQNSSLTKPAFIAFGLVFRNSHSHERADDAAGRGSNGSAAERGHDRARRNEGSDAGNGERANAGQPAECAPKTPPVPTPVTAPSGALVPFSWANSRVLLLSGNSTEISLLIKPASLRALTMLPAWASSRARQNTDLFDIK